MSEDNKEYAPAVMPVTLQAIKNRGSSLQYCDPSYRPPTPDEVKGVIKLNGWSQSTVAKLVGISYTPGKGSSTVRKWQASKDSPEHREIPYSAWRLLLAYSKAVDISEDVDFVKNS